MAKASKPTLILGATTNPARYAYLAANRLQQHGHAILPVGVKRGEVFGEPIRHSIEEVRTELRKEARAAVDTVTLYIGPDKQAQYQNALLALNPERVIFNPGTENPHLRKVLEEAGITTLEACTLVMLSTEQY